MMIALCILTLCLKFTHDYLDEYQKLAQSIKYLEEIDRRLDIENCVFSKVRKGIEEGQCLDADFNISKNNLIIAIKSPVPKRLVYDIMGDDSFIWRRKE